jgi:hypothetical protein
LSSEIRFFAKPQNVVCLESIPSLKRNGKRMLLNTWKTLSVERTKADVERTD